MPVLTYSQLNVFSAEPFKGNPLAVVHGADSLSDDTMAAIARWTNLSETTFLLKPTRSEADYRLRIFTPAGELPFAGHPTLGSCYAWLAAGGEPKDAQILVQECGVGLVTIRKNSERLEFLAPPLIRSGPLAEEMVEQIAAALQLSPSDILHHQWVDNGPGWCAVMLRSAEQVLALKPDWAALAPFTLGVLGAHPAGGPADVEVRAFIGRGAYEDPVTGSLNASLAWWLITAGLIDSPYVARQGTALQRAGRVYLRSVAEEIWVGGDVVEVIRGTISV